MTETRFVPTPLITTRLRGLHPRSYIILSPKIEICRKFSGLCDLHSLRIFTSQLFGTYPCRSRGSFSGL